MGVHGNGNGPFSVACLRIADKGTAGRAGKRGRPFFCDVHYRDENQAWIGIAATQDSNPRKSKALPSTLLGRFRILYKKGVRDLQLSIFGYYNGIKVDFPYFGKMQGQLAKRHKRMR
jgi:hypothetical protein